LEAARQRRCGPLLIALIELEMTPHIAFAACMTSLSLQASDARRLHIQLGRPGFDPNEQIYNHIVDIVRP